MLGLVHEALLGAAVDGLVLACMLHQYMRYMWLVLWVLLTTADLVVERLGVGLAGVGLSASGDLVGAAGEGLLGLVEGGLGGVGGLDGVVSMKWRRSVGMEGDEPSSPQPWCGNLCGMLRT
jgi:hypothetical protein